MSATRQLIDELEAMREEVVRGVFHADFHVWNERHDPCPVYPDTGPVITPPIDLIERITPGIATEDGHVYVHHGKIHAGASFEPPTHPDNDASLKMAGYICRLLNAAPALTKAARLLCDAADSGEPR